jgi:hypothetical protein
MRCGHLGMIANPASGNVVIAGVDWIADNAVFGGNYPGDDAYLSWLSGRAKYRADCRFAVAPDVVCDAAATLERSAPMLAQIRRLGFPVALVAQNGLEHLAVPWDDFDALFIGGDTGWKLGRHAHALAAEARHRGKWVHMGRVNSWLRFRGAYERGCHSVDGTCLAAAPDVYLPQVIAWQRAVDTQLGLWEVAS